MSSKFFYPGPNGQWDVANGNRFRNSLYRVASRGNSIAVPVGGVDYTLDGWRFVNAISTAGTWQVSQSTDVPSLSNLPFSMRCMVTAARASFAGFASEAVEVRAQIEGYDIADLVNNDFHISFWVRSSKTGVHGFSMLSGASATGCYVATYTVNFPNVWEFKIIPIPGGISTTVGTWNFTDGNGIYVNWTLASGSTFFTSVTNQWQGGFLLTTSAQVNCLDTVGNIFAIAGPRMQRGLGQVQMVSQFEPIHEDIARNARYLPVYQAFASGEDVGWGGIASATQAFIGFQHYVPPRASITGIIVSAPGDFTITNLALATTATSILFNAGGGRVTRLLAAGTGSPFSTTQIPAILTSASASAKIIFTGAEL